MSITGHMAKKYKSDSQKFLSSSSRNWPDMLAETWRHGEADYSGVTPADTEIAILLKGKTRVKRSGGGVRQDSIGIPGTIWLCPAGIREDSVYVWGEMEEVVHLFIPAVPLSQTALLEFDVESRNFELLYHGGFQDPLIEQIGRAIVGELECESPVSRMLIDCLRNSLSVHLLKNYSNITPNKLRLESSRGVLDQNRFSKIRDYVMNNLDRSISLDELAGQACLSPFHFARAFKATVGMTPQNFILCEKLDLAKRLMLDRQYSLSEIAFSTGFSTQAHFTRAFKRSIGLTPGAYRAQLGQSAKTD